MSDYEKRTIRKMITIIQIRRPTISSVNPMSRRQIYLLHALTESSYDRSDYLLTWDILKRADTDHRGAVEARRIFF